MWTGSRPARGGPGEHHVRRQRPFAEVKAAVRDKVAAKQAAALARKDGEARLAELQKAPDTALPGASATVSRSMARDVPRELLDAALRAPGDKLPSFIGVDQGVQGYAVVKIAKVLPRDPATGDAVRLQAQYGQAWGDAEAQAYYAALKTRLRAETLPAAALAASTPAAN